MPRQLDALPRVEVEKNLPAGFLQFFFDELDFFLKADVQRMLFRVFAKVVQLVLQFDDRLLEIELVFHAPERLNVFRPAINANSINAKKKAGLASGPRSDEV
jgi:hypothetical protein